MISVVCCGCIFGTRPIGSTLFGIIFLQAFFRHAIQAVLPIVSVKNLPGNRRSTAGAKSPFRDNHGYSQLRILTRGKGNEDPVIAQVAFGRLL
ncbi:hypothetical protein D3C81_1958240 [compost metagenome]